ncbi:hypothetical protein SAMN05880593_106254 [Rhizobium sp. RU36D]|nr:hypothetical protein SAMN05880593_106254 [Rhizobium sp. RU36D]
MKRASIHKRNNGSSLIHTGWTCFKNHLAVHDLKQRIFANRAKDCVAAVLLAAGRKPVMKRNGSWLSFQQKPMIAGREILQTHSNLFGHGLMLRGQPFQEVIADTLLKAVASCRRQF